MSVSSADEIFSIIDEQVQDVIDVLLQSGQFTTEEANKWVNKCCEILLWPMPSAPSCGKDVSSLKRRYKVSFVYGLEMVVGALQEVAKAGANASLTREDFKRVTDHALQVFGERFRQDNPSFFREQ